MKKVLLILSSVFIVFAATAQLADIEYTVITNFVTSHENATGGDCHEWGTEEYTAFLGSWDNVNTTEAGTGCQQCNNNGDCTYAQNITLQTRSNNAYSVVFKIDAWEDDNGSRCSFATGFWIDDDECRRNETNSLNIRETSSPSNSSYTNTPTWGGTNNHTYAFRYTWKYTGTASSISPTCTAQTVTEASGGIRSHSVYLEAGRHYQFETTSGPDTYLRLYGSNGYTIVAFNDDGGAGTLSKLDYTPSSAGWYYLETSRFSRSALTANAVLSYRVINDATNQSCATAIAVGTNSTTTGDTRCASNDNVATCGTSNGTGGGLWYTVTGTGDKLRASLCSGTSYDSKIRVYRGSCGGLTCVAGNDDDCGTRSQIDFCTTSGTTYYILVHGFGANEGTFSLAMSEQPEAPSFSACPGNLTVNTDAGSCNAVVNYTVTATDNCPGYTTARTAGLASGSTFPIGTTTVTHVVTDAGGRTASCSFTVTVNDNEAPAVTCQNITRSLSAAGTASISASDVIASSSDNCGPVNVVSVTPNTFNCSNIGTNNVTVTVNDGRGNTNTCVAVVTIEDNIAPTVTCSNYTVQLNALGTATITPANVYNSGSDNCGTVNLVSVSPNTFSCSDVGSNAVTLTVNDGNGNTNTCSATVTVEDNVNPTAICQNYTLVLNASGTGTISTANINNGSSDACGIALLSLSKTSFTCADVGANTVTLTVTDNNGNVNTCNSTVTVQEAVPTSASAGNDAFICGGASHTLSGNVPSIGTGMWSWTGPGTVSYTSGTASTHNATVSFSVNGTYTGTWTITSNCSSSSDDVQIGVNQPDVVTTTSGASGSCISNNVDDWVHLFDNSGNIIASVDDEGQSMGTVTASVPSVGNATSSNVCGGSKLNAYMGRYFRLFSTNTAWYGNDVNLRLYFTEAELASLIDESLVDHNTSPSINFASNDANGCQDDDDVRNINEIFATKYATGTAAGSAGGTFITPSSSGYDATFQAYYVDVTVNGFSDIFLHGSEHGVALPVELVDFTVETVANKFMQLNWSTATEINNEGFVVERSKDGVHFVKIGFANGNGNSNEMNYYAFQDNDVEVGTYYYRLKQTDFDGEFEYSAIRSATIGGKENVEVSFFIPNPSNLETKLNFVLSKSALVSVQILDGIGRTVYSKTETLSAGSSNLVFDVNDFAVGVYTAKVFVGDQEFIRKLVVRK